MLQALNDHILIEPEAIETYEEQQGFTHVVTPERFKYGPTDPPKWGRVASKGQCCNDFLKVGDRVLYAKFGWALVTYEGTEYNMLREGDILCVDLSSRAS